MVVTGVVAGRAVVEAVVRDGVRFSNRLQIAMVFAILSFTCKMSTTYLEQQLKSSPASDFFVTSPDNIPS